MDPFRGLGPTATIRRRSATTDLRAAPCNAWNAASADGVVLVLVWLYNQLYACGIQNFDMTRKIDIDRMRIASPCHIGWDSMIGDDRARFCGSCDRHVYNIVGLNRTEIESLVENTEGRLCVRMYQRADATVVTADCPVGLRLIRKRVATFAGAALSALLGLVSVGWGQKPEDCAYDLNTKVVGKMKIDAKTGQISGTIFDPSGAVVPGIELRLHLEKRTVAKVNSDTDGNFNIPNLKPAGNYLLRINSQGGWKKQAVKEIAVRAGERTSYSVCIKPGNVYVTVGIFAAAEEVSAEPLQPVARY